MPSIRQRTTFQPRVRSAFLDRRQGRHRGESPDLGETGRGDRGDRSRVLNVPVTPCLPPCHPERSGFPFVSPLSPLSPLKKKGLCTRTRFYATLMLSRFTQGGKDL